MRLSSPSPPLLLAMAQAQGPWPWALLLRVALPPWPLARRRAWRQRWLAARFWGAEPKKRRISVQPQPTANSRSRAPLKAASWFTERSCFPGLWLSRQPPGAPRNFCTWLCPWLRTNWPGFLRCCSTTRCPRPRGYWTITGSKRTAGPSCRRPTPILWPRFPAGPLPTGAGASATYTPGSSTTAPPARTAECRPWR